MQTRTRANTQCTRCTGRMLYDRLDGEWRCLLCGRARRRRTLVTAEDAQPGAAVPRRSAFRRRWDIGLEELRFDCGG